MKTIEFYDSDGNKLRVQHSSSVNESYRIYIKFAGRDGEIPNDDDWNHCLHLKREQAEILINALQDLFNDHNL